MTRTYTELSALSTFEERFNYLKLEGSVGNETFGFERYLNQKFYRSREWQRVRDTVIIRDNGCDLGIDGRFIVQHIIIHHLNPINSSDIQLVTANLLDPEFLICVSHDTHNAIHYGDATLLAKDYTERKPGDTTLWKKQK